MNYDICKEKITQFLTFLAEEKNVSHNTVRAYRADLAQFTSFWERLLTQGPKEAVTPEYVVRRYVVALFYEKMCKTTLARKLSCLRSFSAYLKDQGITLEVNVKPPKIERRLPVTLTVDEMTYLLDEVKVEELPSKHPWRDHAIMEMLYATGVRCAELTHMRLCDINMKEKMVRVLGKGRKERVVLFGEKAKKAVETYIEKERALYGLDEEGFLFLGKSGKRIAERSVQRICEMYRSLLRVERQLTPHKIRHSFATHLLNQGVDLRMIQELLGHRTLSTVEIYTHVSSAQLAKVCDDKHPLNALEEE
jgi:integrase/recombinase XerC